MANKNKKKKTTKKKSTVTNKKSTTKKKTTTTKKSTKPKKSTTKTSTAVTKNNNAKKTITNSNKEKKEELVLPKYKVKTKDVSKNKNIPSKVVNVEEFKNLKKDNSNKKTKEVSKKSSRSNDKRIAKNKKNNLKKNLDKTIRKIRMYGITSVVPKKYLIGIVSLLLLIIILPMIIGLTGNNNKIDLSVIPEKVDQLTVVSFDIDDVSSIISESGSFDSLRSYYEYDFKEVFDLDPSYVSEYSINYNKSKKQLLIVIKPTDDNYDNVKNTFDKFLKDNKITDYKYFDYQGYQIYINSNNNDIVASKIRQSQKRVFNILRELKKDEIEQTFGIPESYYSESLVKVAMVVKSDTCEYAIFKPVNDNAKTKIKNAMEEYYSALELKWSNNEENENLVKNRYFEEYQGYLIYVVSHDNEMVVDLIKKS